MTFKLVIAYNNEVIEEKLLDIEQINELSKQLFDRLVLLLLPICVPYAYQLVNAVHFFSICVLPSKGLTYCSTSATPASPPFAFASR
jgi:putative effector of murein hydrolase LrgA (UPF0299 family)